MKTTTILFAGAVMLSAATASAQTPASTAMLCRQQLADLTATWTTLMPNVPSKPLVAQVPGRQGHTHTGIDYNYMSSQFRQAAHACDAGHEHEAMRHMDAVRTTMRLPAVAYPAAHHYQAAKL